ncbi:hypothetical protein [Tardiphaga sp. P9-11]|jgi:hypothetical protein|uniref:hypothetical protein n=1 Tax=Tardiphaga sp. P9-11 TaxID=2024614 RepID=UPI0011F1D2D8|nr:hypothetical protein [Tardiphaga sp. P9-11]KAA0078069.1 hypothetical protein CIW50_03260 [Tardiphaga sp. P9-11]
MQKRDSKIRRIAAVQARLHRIAEWQLMECQARENQLEEKQRLILEGFNDESKLPDLAVQTASQSLRAASIEQGVVAKTKERLAAHARDEGRKLKHALKMVKSAVERTVRADEKRVLDDEVDKAVRRSIEGA